MAFTPIYDVRLEIDCARLSAECSLALIIREGTSVPEADRPDLAKFLNEVAAAIIRCSMPEVLSFDINDHVRHHLHFLESHEQCVREASEHDAIRLILPSDHGQWIHALDPGLATVVESYGVTIETDPHEE